MAQVPSGSGGGRATKGRHGARLGQRLRDFSDVLPVGPNLYKDLNTGRQVKPCASSGFRARSNLEIHPL